MDVVTSAFAVASAAATATLTITKLVIDSRDLKDELVAAQAELTSIERIIFTIADLINEKTSAGAAVSVQLSERLFEVIERCEAAIADTSAVVNKYVSSQGVVRTARWLAAGKDELKKLQGRLAACKLDLDLMLNLLNASLASATERNTSQIQRSNVGIQREVQGIILGIQSLQNDHSQMIELLTSLKALQEHNTGNILLDRFIDSLTDYAETVCERTIIDADDDGSPTRETVIPSSASMNCEKLSESDSGVSLHVDHPPTTPPPEQIPKREVLPPSRYRRPSLPVSTMKDAISSKPSTPEEPTKIVSVCGSSRPSPTSTDALRNQTHPQLLAPGPCQSILDKQKLGAQLMQDVYNYDAVAVKHILSQGADVNMATIADEKRASRCSTSVNILFEAIRFAIKRNTIAKMIPVIDILLQAGASPLSPVPCSKGHKHTSILSESINALSKELHHSLLYSDAPYKSSRYRLMPIIIHKLIKHGADPNHKDEKPLLIALRNNNPAITNVLACHGARIPKTARWDPCKSETDLKLTTSILRNINVHYRTKQGNNRWLALLIKSDKSFGATVLCGTITALTTEDHMSFSVEFLVHAVEQMILCGADPSYRVEMSYSRSKLRIRPGKIRWSVPVFEAVSALELSKYVDVGFETETVKAWKAIQDVLRGADCAP